MSMHAWEEIVKQIEQERESSTIAELTKKLNDAMQIRAAHFERIIGKQEVIP